MTPMTNPTRSRKLILVSNRLPFDVSFAHGAAAEAPGDQWKAAECFGCMNCTDSCNRDSLQFGLASPLKIAPGEESIDLSKRGLLAAAVGGVEGERRGRVEEQVFL